MLYVTLEPCSTAGRTGSCAEAIIAAGINLFGGPLGREQRALELLKRPGIGYADLFGLPGMGEPVDDAGVALQVQIQARYAGYIARPLRLESQLPDPRRAASKSVPRQLLRSLTEQASGVFVQVKFESPAVQILARWSRMFRS